jgi:transposase InsO family protein
LEHPEFEDQGRFPFQFETLHAYHKACKALQEKPAKKPDRFQRVRFGTTKLICFRQNGEDKIVLPESILPRVVAYYHKAMAHVEGMSRLAQTLKRHYYHPKLSDQIKKLKDCPECLRFKRGGKVYGEAAPRDAFVTPRQQIHCDTVGPWKIALRAREITFMAMTIIDAATNLLEIAPMNNKTAAEAAAVVENNWIARYPRPLRCVTDQGSEFGFEFQDMLRKNGVTHSTSTARNPQGNSIIERTHPAVGQVLRTVVASKNPKSAAEGDAVVRECLATVMHACRCMPVCYTRNNRESLSGCLGIWSGHVFRHSYYCGCFDIVSSSARIGG